MRRAFPTAFLLPLDCLLMPQINCQNPIPTALNKYPLSAALSLCSPPSLEPTIDGVQLLPLPTFNDNSVSCRCHMRHIPRLIRSNMRPSSSWKLRQDVDQKLIITTTAKKQEEEEQEEDEDRRQQESKRATTISRTRGDSSCDAVKCGTSFARRTRPVLNFWTNSKRKIWKRIMLTAEKSYNFLPRRQRHKAKTAKNKNAKSVTQKVDSVKDAATQRRSRRETLRKWGRARNEC